MGGKVSMVMACYNKAPYLGEMLRSVWAQTWEAVELVFVNDGSTDGSMDVFREWEPKLRERGIEVVLCEQENAGVTAAIKAGLERVSGDYVCFLDADDELDPRYAEMLAAPLEDDPGLDFTLCAYAVRNEPGGRVDTEMEPDRDFLGDQLLERYLLCRISSCCYRYLFRMGYVRTAGLPELLDTARAGSQEPSLMLPLLAADGSYKRIPGAFYIYNRYVQGLAQSQKKNPFDLMAGDYHAQQLRAIERLPVSERRKLELASYSQLGMVRFCNMLLGNPAHADGFLLAMANRILQGTPGRINLSGRVIAYGSLGRNARRVLPEFKGTDLWPSMFWDKAAREDSAVFDGTPVTPPRPEEIRPGDTILCLPNITEVYEDARTLAGARGAVCLSYFDIMDTLAALRYGE